MADGGYFDSYGHLDGTGGLIPGIAAYRPQMNAPRYGRFVVSKSRRHLGTSYSLAAVVT